MMYGHIFCCLYYSESLELFLDEEFGEIPCLSLDQVSKIINACLASVTKQTAWKSFHFSVSYEHFKLG